jgi:dTDP-4-amino-4,6-dideoxygalactose transaminase
MRTIADYKDPFQSILDFESAVAQFTGAPYCITTDCCTHAIEIVFRIKHNGSPVAFPAKNYLEISTKSDVLTRIFPASPLPDV